ncbi:hypothetical protein HYV10_01195 [Candidatus Dependentiae bacterium]|nr:hypothetical protein [Candidatus Dependentiae bacterium]
MRYIKNSIIIFCVYTQHIYNSDYYFFKFHLELPIHYRAEMFLLDNRYQRLIQNFKVTQDSDWGEVFERMEYVLFQLSCYKIAQYNYQESLKKYRNKVAELKNKRI